MSTNPPKSRSLWILIIALLIVLGLVYMFSTSGEPAEAPLADEAPAGMATAPSDEYTTAPEQEGVAVDLPDTPPAVEPTGPGAVTEAE